MTFTFAKLQGQIVSVGCAFVFAALMIGAAVPLSPIA